MAVLLGFAALALAACAGESPYSTLRPGGPVAEKQAELYMLVFWIATGVFVVVEGALIYTVIRFRRRSAADSPKQLHGNARLEVAWTIVPALILAFVAVPTVGTIFDLAEEPEGALRIEVIGNQWWWDVRYPSLDVVTANEVHIPTGEQVILELSSKDVIHAFWVPRLAGKQDLVPGRTNTMNFAADAPGTYLGQCAEFCGLSHANMRFRVIAHEPADFDAWVRQQRAPAATPQGGTTEEEGLAVFQNVGCIACHTVSGVENAAGTIGPNLTHIGSRQTIAAGILPNDAEHLEEWIANPPAVKPGSKMPRYPMSEEQLEDLVAYLRSLK